MRYAWLFINNQNIIRYWWNTRQCVKKSAGGISDTTDINYFSVLILWHLWHNLLIKPAKLTVPICSHVLKVKYTNLREKRENVLSISKNKRILSHEILCKTNQLSKNKTTETTQLLFERKVFNLLVLYLIETEWYVNWFRSKWKLLIAATMLPKDSFCLLSSFCERFVNENSAIIAVTGCCLSLFHLACFKSAVFLTRIWHVERPRDS